MRSVSAHTFCLKRSNVARAPVVTMPLNCVFVVPRRTERKELIVVDRCALSFMRGKHSIRMENVLTVVRKDSLSHVPSYKGMYIFSTSVTVTGTRIEISFCDLEEREYDIVVLSSRKFVTCVSFLDREELLRLPLPPRPPRLKFCFPCLLML